MSYFDFDFFAFFLAFSFIYFAYRTGVSFRTMRFQLASPAALLLVALGGFLPAGRRGVMAFVVPSAQISSSPLVQTHLASTAANKDIGTASDLGTTDAFLFRPTDIDDTNTPPSFHKFAEQLRSLKSGSDIRGAFSDHARVGSIFNVLHSTEQSTLPPLTPLAAYCFGASFAEMVKSELTDKETVKICIGVDPRPHGIRLADAFARGVESVDDARASFTGLATTPSMSYFCRANLCDGGAMITASHLPEDRNGIKLFTQNGGFTKTAIDALITGSVRVGHRWHEIGILPPSSGHGAVDCSHVDFMPHYSERLRQAIVDEVGYGAQPLDGIKIVLNAGDGSGSFFNEILSDLGADVSHSLYLNPDGTFPPTGVPNPENKDMMEETKARCKECQADIGILFDTDADRSGFILPRGDDNDYEPLNRNRLIALLSVIFANSSPGCTIVTDSVTSEGLATFLTDKLGLQHCRHLKGYANVIGKAMEITESGQGNAEMAIETSGHCAMKENGYLDDGTYTAVKVIGLLARTMKNSNQADASLLKLIAGLEEKAEENELRMPVIDGTIGSTQILFDQFASLIENAATASKYHGWELDEENLEGVRVRIGNGGFFMFRKSLHDPLVSLQVEGDSVDEVRMKVIQPILSLIGEYEEIMSGLDISVLQDY